MNRLFVALSTLALLLAAAPASATPPQPLDLCEPPEDPSFYIVLLSADINTQNYQGPLCLKMCKAELAGCKKVSASVRKCKNAASKAQWKTFPLNCQLKGGEKKSCTEVAKGASKVARDSWKAELLAHRASCDSAHQACRAACAP